MEQASKDLMRDHEDILLTLNILEAFCFLLRTKQEVDLVDITRIIYFIKIFADECHHGKEERILFPAIQKTGNKKLHELIGELLTEHERERKLIQSILDSVLNDPFQPEIFIRTSNSYINHLRNHIGKENYILFPQADKHLSYCKQTNLLNELEVFENVVIGNNFHPVYHSMLEKIELRYYV